MYRYDARFHGDSAKPSWVRFARLSSQVDSLVLDKYCPSRQFSGGVGLIPCCNTVVMVVLFELQGHHVARLAADLRDFLDELDLKVQQCSLILRLDATF